MALATKLGSALLVALISNATLLSFLLSKQSQTSGSDSSVKTTITDSDNIKFTTTVSSAEVYNSHGADSESEVDRLGDRNEDENSGEITQDRHSEDQHNVRHKPRQRQRQQRRRRVENEVSPRQQRRSTRPTGHYLNDVIAGLTEQEKDALEPGVASVLVPALIGLESLVLRELERLHDVNVNQELRLERLEKQHLENQELLAAAETIRENNEKEKQKENSSSSEEKGDNRSEQADMAAEVAEISGGAMLEGEDGGSGSGEVSLATTTATTTTATANYTNSPDSAIINHIYSIYSSLTSMEHKVAELGTSISVLSSEIYRQRSSFVNIEDKLEELRRSQRNLVMRTTVHTFKLSDLEQFKAQAEMLLQTAETDLEQFEARLEVFKDRVTAQQDEMHHMRSTFGRLEQASSELRASDSYKAHDIQELKRGAMQIEQRLMNVYHTVDSAINHIRLDFKGYWDHMCSANNLKC